MAQHDHVRGDKVPTYLAAFGFLPALSTALLITFSAPIVTLGVAAGAVVMGVTDRGRGILRKVADQLLDLGGDVLSHVSEDFGRVKNWWHNHKERKEAEKTASINNAVTAFKNANAKPSFDEAAKPAVTVEQAPAPVVAPPVIKADAPKL